MADKEHKISVIAGAFNHRVMLADHVRTEAFQRAIDAVVRPGMRVMDLGTGTGVLAMMAARAGAEHVVAVDVDPVVSLARKVAADNGFDSDRITFHHCDSRTLELDEPVDVVISECMGNFFVSDEMQLVLTDAKRFLKPNGIFLPQSLDLYLAPVFYPQLYEVDFWAQSHYGFRFDAALPVALNRCYVYHVASELMLSAPARYKHVSFDALEPNLSGNVSFTLEKSLTLHGFVGWFEAQLADGVTLSTRPGADTTHWGQTVFPVQPVSVRTDDTVDLSLSFSHENDALDRIQWDGRVVREGQVAHEFAHDTHKRFV